MTEEANKRPYRQVKSSRPGDRVLHVRTRKRRLATVRRKAGGSVVAAIELFTDIFTQTAILPVIALLALMVVLVPIPLFLIERSADDADMTSYWRKQRTVPAPVKRALWARDGGCSFPGCTHTRFVDAHHIRHWADGGETSLENTMLLCGGHHRLVHEGGYDIRKDYQGRWYFMRPDGRAIPWHRTSISNHRSKSWDHLISGIIISNQSNSENSSCV